MRRLFALAVLVIHGFLLLLLVSGVRPDRLGDAVMSAYTSLWITLNLPAPLEIEPDPEPAPQRAEKPRSSAPASFDPVVEQPAETSVESAIDLPESAPTLAPVPGANVDWEREGTLAARRAADRFGDEQKEFSPPPKTVSKPCVPRKSSMEWNGDEDRRVTWVGLMPVFKIGSCMVTIGAFACGLGAEEVNGHLLDDMRSPDRHRSSVPDPNICD